MFRLLSILLLASVAPARAAGLSQREEASLREFVLDYASWDFSGKPVDFREQLDYVSYEEQRKLLLEMAALDWNGFWGRYWRHREIRSVEMLRGLRPRSFWLCYHGALLPTPAKNRSRSPNVRVDIHAIAMQNGVAFVTYQAAYRKGELPEHGKLSVLRARLVDGTWRLIAFPGITAKYRDQVQRLRAEQRQAKPTPARTSR
jgi:hypothetical protein